MATNYRFSKQFSQTLNTRPARAFVGITWCSLVAAAVIAAGLADPAWAQEYRTGAPVRSKAVDNRPKKPVRDEQVKQAATVEEASEGGSGLFEDEPEFRLAQQPPAAPGTPPVPPLPATQAPGSQPQTNQPRPSTQTPQQNQQQQQNRNLGASASTLGGARGAQSNAPYMIGDTMGTNNSNVTIPIIAVPGSPLSPQTFIITPSVPIQLPSNSANPVQFTSPNNPPFFPPRNFLSSDSSSSINSAFFNAQSGGPINNFSTGLQESSQYSNDVLTSLNAQNPSGTVLSNGQVAAGTGTVTFQDGQAVFDAANSPPTGGPPRNLLDGSDQFTLQNSYVYTPDVIAGATSGSTSQPQLIVPDPAGAGGAVLGITKIAENTSPLPRDRVFFNYSMFDNVPLIRGGASVNRFTPGFEKTFFDRLMSIEMRFPFAASVDPALFVDGVTPQTTTFGNISVVPKVLLWTDDEFAFSMGLQVTVPTADDLSIGLTNGTTLVNVENESVHLMPFVGALYTPNEQFFAQGFLQVDVDSNGNSVFINPTLTQLEFAGRIHAATQMYVSLGAGYWTYRNQYARVSGFAPTFELHYNQSLQDTDVIVNGDFQIGRVASNVTLVNATLGSYIELGGMTTVAVGYTVPLAGGGADTQFDGEFRCFVNRRFGPQSRATRAASPN